MERELDTPDPYGQDTSAIGPKWPPRQTSFGRVKGFYDGSIVETGFVLDDILQSVDGWSKRLGQSIPSTRVSLRAVVNNELFRSRWHDLREYGEAVIDLDGTRGCFEGCSVLYLGNNHPGRHANPVDLEECFRNLNEALRHPLSSASAHVARVSSQGYVLGTLSEGDRIGNAEVVDDLALLYTPFGWARADVQALLTNKDNIISVAKFNERVVSAGIAEVAQLNLEGGEVLRMAELTDAATLPAHGGKGLYSAVSTRMLQELDGLSLQGEGIDVVFGECNGVSLSVLKVAKSQGRTFSPQICQFRNLPFRGVLPQHVPIAGGSKNSPFNDLIPAYLTQQEVAHFVRT